MNRDPRDIEQDEGLDLFGKLSDDEQEHEHGHGHVRLHPPTEELTEVEREMKEMEAKMEELKRKQAALQQQQQGKIKPKAEQQVGRTPSPKKEHTHPTTNRDIKPKNLNQRLREANEESNRFTASSSSSSSDVSKLTSYITSTPSYFLQSLKDSAKKQEEEKAIARKLIQSRIYTFDATLEVSPTVVNEMEFYSGQHISRRYVDGERLKEFLSDKKVMRLPKLMAKVCPPEFEEPKYPNWVVVGILSKKSKPKITAGGKGKYVAFTLTDFKYNVQVTMFGKAVEKYNKLRAGDIIALLNPDIYIKLEASAGGSTNTGFKTFSLTIKHDGDSILEIGRSRDFGFCPSMRKDGTICSEPINRALEQCCSYHQELRMRKTAGKRMEFQTSVRQISPTRNGLKQDFLLGKPDKLGGWTNSSIVTNTSAPANDRVSLAKKHFSDTTKHQAFFNSEVSDLSDIAKKRVHQKGHQDRVNDIKLQKKLHKTLEGGQNLKKSTSVKAEGDLGKMISMEERKALLKYAYGSNGISELGFDPSSRGASKGVLSYKDAEEKRQISATAAELSDLAKRRKVDLSVADEVLKMRKEQRKKTDEYLKRIKKEKTDQQILNKVKAEKEREIRKEKARSDVIVPASFMLDHDADEHDGDSGKAVEVFELSDSDDGLVELETDSAFERFKKQQEIKREKSV